MLTKKHFEAIARIIAETTVNDPQVENLIIKDQLVQSMIDYLAKENLQFDRWKFYRLCYKS